MTSKLSALEKGGAVVKYRKFLKRRMSDDQFRRLLPRLRQFSAAYDDLWGSIDEATMNGGDLKRLSSFHGLKSLKVGCQHCRLVIGAAHRGLNFAFHRFWKRAARSSTARCA